MSRRSSVSSTGSATASGKSGVDDDPLMRDCYDLRRRLLQTEQSLQNMKPPNLTTSDRKSRLTRLQQEKTESTDRNRNYPNGTEEHSPKHVRWSIDLESDRQAAINTGNSINLTSIEKDNILTSQSPPNPPLMNTEYIESGPNVRRQERLTRYVELYAARAGRRRSSNESKTSSDEKLSESFESPTSNPLTSPGSRYISPHLMDKGSIYDRQLRGRKDDMRRFANFKLHVMNAGSSESHHLERNILQKDFKSPSNAKRQIPSFNEGFIARNTKDSDYLLKKNNFRTSPLPLPSAGSMNPKQISPLRQNVAALQRRSVLPLRSKSISPPITTNDLIDNSKFTPKTSPQRVHRFSNVRHRYYPMSPTSVEQRNGLLYVQKAAIESGLPKAKPKHTRSHTAPSYLSQVHTPPHSTDTSYLENSPRANWQELRKQRLQIKKRRLLPSTPSTPVVKQDRDGIDAATLLDNSLGVLGKSKAHQFSSREYSINTGRNFSTSPESAQILTLSDLTPPVLDTRRGTTPASVGNYSFKSSLPDVRNGSTQSSPRDMLESHSFGSDYDHDTLRRKLNKHREENSQLVNQNHKLMSELENMSFELHQARNKNANVVHDLDDERAKVKSLEDRIVDLESELAKQEDQARISELKLKECQEELHSKDEELKSVFESSNIAETELREESKLRKRTESQLQDALRSVEELTDKLADQDNAIKILRQQSSEQQRSLREALNHSQKESGDSYKKMSTMEAQLHDLKEEIRLLQQESTSFEENNSSLQQENASLRATISRQSQKIGRLENELKKNSPYSRDNNQELQGVIERQREKILQYQQEIEDTKNHMARLEDLVHRVQEQSMKEHVNATPSTADSGIYHIHSKLNGYHSNSSPDSDGSYLNGDHGNMADGEPYISPGKTRALVADLKLKLAMKEAEIQKLQAGAVARAAAQQKHIAGLTGDGGTMDNLRSELSAIMERSRMGDRKQYELEQMVTRLEDEISRYSSQNIQLEERLADKMSHIASMEEKLGQRNLRIVDLQKELEGKITEINELLRDVRQRDSQISHLERQLDNKYSEQTSITDQLKTLRDEIKTKTEQVKKLEEAVKNKDTEIHGTTSLVEKVKTLHNEQCQELQAQIEQLQKKFEEKSVLVLKLESELTGTRQELKHKTSSLEKAEQNLKENVEKLNISENNNKTQNKKFAEIESQAQDATSQMKHLQSSLAECQDEIKVYMQQLEEMRKDHDDEIQNAHVEISKLQSTMKQLSSDLEHKTAYISKLEQVLSEKEAGLQKERERCRELQESRVHLQQQVSLMDEEIHRERNTSQNESYDYQQKLKDMKASFDQKNSEALELNATLKEMHQDMKKSSANMVELEHLLQESRSMNDKKTAQLQTIEVGYKETRTQLSQQTKRNGELEEHIRHLESDLKQKDEQNTQLDKEVKKIETELHDTISQLKSLEDVLQTSKYQVEEKEKKVNELDKMLNESIEELQKKQKDIISKDTQIAELDQALKETQKEVKTRDSQVSQLDITMKENRNEQQQKIVALDQSLNQARYQLSERAVEIAELKAKLDQAEDTLRQKKNRLEHYEKTAKQQQLDMKKRITQINDLQKEADKLRKRKQESEETNQELRLAREQLQTTHAELIEARRDLLKYQSREQELIHELDDAHTLLNAKEHDCTRLAKDLGASQVREAEAEARCVQEMRKTQQQHEIKQVSQEHELKRLQESHAKLLSQREELQAEKNLAINKLKDTNQQLTRELADYKDANSHLSQETKQLTNQLTGYQDELKSVNESMVIKEAEITRLEARISGYERAMFGTRQHFDRLGANSPRPSPALRAHVRHVTSPRALTDLKKSSSDHNLHNLSESSAYSILDTDDFIHSLDHVIERGRSHTPLEVPSLLTRRQDLSSTKTSQTAAKYEKDNLDAVPESDLDPSQCRASLKEKLRASEERRKQIDKQLHTMKSSIS